MISLAILLVLAQDTTRLTMAGVIDRALAQYPSIGVARAGRSRAAADARDAAAALRPRLVLDASATHYQEPFLVYPLHGFPAPAAPATLPPFDRTLIQGSAFASWTLFDFGQRRSRLRAARAFEGAADAALTTAQAAVVARTATAYLRVLTAREVLAAQDQRLVALEAESARARRLLAEGTVPRLMVLRADAALARARAERTQATAQRDVAEQTLARLADLNGADVGRAALAPASLADTAAALPARDSLVARAVASSPEILESRRRSDAARAGANASRATRYPELRLLTGIVDRGATGHDFRAEWQAGFSLAHSLYTGGQRGAQIARADADASLADAQHRQAELNAAEAVDRALAAASEARGRSAALASALEQTLAVAEVERTSLEIGSGTQTDYLDALADVVRERSALSEARHAELAALIELARVTGRLTIEWLNLTVAQRTP